MSHQVLRLTRTTDASAEPISLTDAKAHLRVTSTDEDDLITNLIKEVRDHTENYLSRALINQTWKLYLDFFPSVISIPRPPLSSVTTIEYVDTDGVTQTLANSVYTVDTDAEPGLIYEAYNQNWPTHRDVQKAITITFVGGYGASSSSIPPAIIRGMYLFIGHYYENREASAPITIKEIPFSARALFASYRIMRV